MCDIVSKPSRSQQLEQLIDGPINSVIGLFDFGKGSMLGVSLTFHPRVFPNTIVFGNRGVEKGNDFSTIPSIPGLCSNAHRCQLMRFHGGAMEAIKIVCS